MTTKLKENEVAHIQSNLSVTKAKELPAGEFVAVLSTDSLDRHGEHVSIKGMTIPKRTIRMYFNHITSGAILPVGTWLKIWKSKDGKLMGHGKIDLVDEFEQNLYKKIQLGTIDSISIGFIPKEYDGETDTWTKAELSEASVVNEPANPDAIITQKQGFTEEEFEQSLKVKLKETKAEDLENDESDPPEEQDKPTIEVKRIVKGAVTDILTTPNKWKLMRPFHDIIFAFEDAYYKETATADEFKPLLDETITLLKKLSKGTYDLTKSCEDGAVIDTEIKAAIEELKSRIGAVEEAGNSTTDNPAINLIKVRLAAKQVDKSAEELNKTIKVKLKGTSNV